MEIYNDENISYDPLSLVVLLTSATDIEVYTGFNPSLVFGSTVLKDTSVVPTDSSSTGLESKFCGW